MPRAKSDTTELKTRIKALEKLVHQDGLVIAKMQKQLYKGIHEVREGISNTGLDDWADATESILLSVANGSVK